MRTHQRYFGVLEESAWPAPRFVMVANTETADGNAAIVAGNERVLRARLADARFFWDQDQSRQTGRERLPALEGVVFHARLGSMYRRRPGASQSWPAPSAHRWTLPTPRSSGAAGLALQGRSRDRDGGRVPRPPGAHGRYYAEADGEDPAVCEAIKPSTTRRRGREISPTGPVSVAVALADKLDTLAGFFAIDERPTGSKDPFALRRAALGVIRAHHSRESCGFHSAMR